MKQTKKSQKADVKPSDKLLPRLTMLFFKRSIPTALLWCMVAVFGVLSYTTLLKREGFPSVTIPIVIVNGSYAVNDATKVDDALARPLSDVALKQPGVKSVQVTTDTNFFTAVVQYAENTNAKTASRELEAAVKAAHTTPAGAHVQYSAPYFGVTGGSSKKVDATISLYSPGANLSHQELIKKAEAATKYLNDQKLSQVKEFFVDSPYETVRDPASGQAETIQRSFDTYGLRTQGQTRFYDSAIIGVTSVKGSDVIKLDDQLRGVLARLQKRPDFKDVRAAVSASYAPSIKESISELQRVLLEGLIAVLVVGSIIIAVRASVITVLSMVTVIAVTTGLLYLVGYSLNVITLFALILGLSLVVDDTIIMVEAIDASRKRAKTAAEAVRMATRKIARAMVAATLTAALSFVPLLFVGGILGSFIRAIPVTIISALLISLCVALIFIPLFAKVLLLGKKQLGEGNVVEVAAEIEHRIARAISRPMLWAQHSRKKEFGVGITAVVIGIVFIAAAGFIFSRVAFNIFPPTKDSNQLNVTLGFAPGTSIDRAEQITDDASRIIARELGSNFDYSSQYGMANSHASTLYVNLVPYDKRVATSPELVKKLNNRFESFTEARASATQIDVGPPASAFTVTVDASDRPKAIKLAEDIESYLKSVKLVRTDGSVAHTEDVHVEDPSVYVRIDGKSVISVSATFDGDDTTALTDLARTAVEEKYTPQVLSSFGIGKDAVSFELGQEQENQDSFKTLALAFPLVLLAIYILLAVQFRSLLQPLLIFMALPFSLFGVTLGLYLTDNAFSFFAMLGFFALIGLSIKNTILLTDYANQARRSGLSPIDSAVAALGERFRPLIATSITAVVSLIPLAVTSPFWQGLAVVLIFGLLSSTLLVVTIFPYFYLGAEYLRLRVSRRRFLKWFGLAIGLIIVITTLVRSL
jgi:multidrug efflux pump subunit AcrB